MAVSSASNQLRGEQRGRISSKQFRISGLARIFRRVATGESLSRRAKLALLTVRELSLVRRIIGDFPRLSQPEPASTIRELLEWRRPNASFSNIFSAAIRRVSGPIFSVRSHRTSQMPLPVLRRGAAAPNRTLRKGPCALC